jgi:hypothetical protein
MTKTEFWPDGARLAVKVSMQFEAGGQPISGAPGPVSDQVEPGCPDLPQNSSMNPRSRRPSSGRPPN